MATGSPYRPSYGAKDWTARLPPGSPGADTGMVVQPYADPGYGMPNAFVGNLNQSPGLVVGGVLRANALQGVDPSSDNPLSQALPYGQFVGSDAELSPLERWLAQQRAKNNAQGYEPLPGVTSGVPPKPWGLDRTQLPQQPPPQPYQSGFVANILNRVRPMDPTSDPGMTIGDEAIPGTRSRTPVIMNERPQWKYRET